MNKRTPTYGLTHIAVAVKDLERTKLFYQAVFDMEVMYDEEDFIQLTTPGTYDILVFEKKKNTSGNSGGIAHFGFRLRTPEAILGLKKKIKTAGGNNHRPGRILTRSTLHFL